MDQAETKPRSRRWVYALAISLVAGGIAVACFEPTQVIVGTLSGDAFFRGRPTRYWTGKLNAGPAQRADAESQLQEGGTESVPVLTEILRGSSTTQTAESRFVAAQILILLGPDAAAAGPALIQGARDTDPHLQAVCAAGLPKISVPAETAVPLLTELLKTKHGVVAARALSEYRGAASSSLPSLLELLRDKSQLTEVRWNAARTSGKIGPAALSAVPDLIDAMTDKEPTIREHSAEAIGDIGPVAAEGVPALIKVLTDDDPRVRRDAVRSLGNLGPAAQKAVPAIKKLLLDPVDRVKEAILPALKAIAPEEAAAIEAQIAKEKAKKATPKKD